MEGKARNAALVGVVVVEKQLCADSILYELRKTLFLAPSAPNGR